MPPVSPFSASPGHGPGRLAAVRVVVIVGCLAVAVAVALAVAMVLTVHRAPGPALLVQPSVVKSRVPAPSARLPQVPAPLTVLRLPVTVEESCVGRQLPGESWPPNGPAPLVSGDLRRPWRCDGDGAKLRSPQSAGIWFPRTVTLSAIGVLGYDVVEPCRFVTGLEVLIGRKGYELRLPAARYPRPLWFGIPEIRSNQVTLIVRATMVTGAGSGAACDRTAIAGLGFAGR